MMLDKEKAMGLVDQVNTLHRRAELKRQHADILRAEGFEADAKMVDEDADSHEIKAQLLVDGFFFPEAVPTDTEEVAQG